MAKPALRTSDSTRSAAMTCFLVWSARGQLIFLRHHVYDDEAARGFERGFHVLQHGPIVSKSDQVDLLVGLRSGVWVVGQFELQVWAGSGHLDGDWVSLPSTQSP